MSELIAQVADQTIVPQMERRVGSGIVLPDWPRTRHFISRDVVAETDELSAHCRIRPISITAHFLLGMLR